MKSPTSTAEATEKSEQSSKSSSGKSVGGRKTARRSGASAAASRRSKSRASIKTSTRRGSRKTSNGRSSASGYSEGATRFLSKAKQALGDAYGWAGETGAALPRQARKIPLPDQRAVETYMGDRPMMVAAVGLGLGVAIGAMIHYAGYDTRRRSRGR